MKSLISNLEVNLNIFKPKNSEITNHGATHFPFRARFPRLSHTTCVRQSSNRQLLHYFLEMEPFLFLNSSKYAQVPVNMFTCNTELHLKFCVLV